MAQLRVTKTGIVRRRFHPIQQLETPHMPSRWWDSKEKSRVEKAWLTDCILSSCDYSHLDNLRLLAEDATEGQFCKHANAQAKAGTDDCILCQFNYVYEFGREIDDWFKRTYGYLFEGTADKDDLVRSLRAQIAERDECIARLCGDIHKLQEALAFERGMYTEMSPEEIEAKRDSLELRDPSSMTKDEYIAEMEAVVNTAKADRDAWRKALDDRCGAYNNLYSRFKAIEKALRIMRGDSPKLINILSNLCQEVELLNAGIGPLLMDKFNAWGGKTLLCVQAADGNVIDRFCVNPEDRESLRVMKTEKYCYGTGETHVIVKGAYGSSNTTVPPNRTNDPPVGYVLPLRTNHVVASDADIELMSTQLADLAKTANSLYGANPHTINKAAQRKNKRHRQFSDSDSDGAPSRLRSQVVVPQAPPPVAGPFAPPRPGSVPAMNRRRASATVTSATATSSRTNNYQGLSTELDEANLPTFTYQGRNV